jgi:uncharacterized BrkB/YihY/UPF0761 family membrane protein
MRLNKNVSMALFLTPLVIFVLIIFSLIPVTIIGALLTNLPIPEISVILKALGTISMFVIPVIFGITWTLGFLVYWFLSRWKVESWPAYAVGGGLAGIVGLVCVNSSFKGRLWFGPSDELFIGFILGVTGGVVFLYLTNKLPNK